MHFLLHFLRIFYCFFHVFSVAFSIHFSSIKHVKFQLIYPLKFLKTAPFSTPFFMHYLLFFQAFFSVFVTHFLLFFHTFFVVFFMHFLLHFSPFFNTFFIKNFMHFSLSYQPIHIAMPLLAMLHSSHLYSSTSTCYPPQWQPCQVAPPWKMQCCSRSNCISRAYAHSKMRTCVCDHAWVEVLPHHQVHGVGSRLSYSLPYSTGSDTLRGNWRCQQWGWRAGAWRRFVSRTLFGVRRGLWTWNPNR